MQKDVGTKELDQIVMELEEENHIKVTGKNDTLTTTRVL